VQPSDAGYIAAALTDRPTPVIFNQNATSGTTVTVSVPWGKLLAFYVVQDDSTYDYLHDNVSTGWTYNETHGPPHHPAETSPLRPNVWFMNAGANRDGQYQHFRFQPISTDGKLYEVEDLAGGGDQDFNDFVFSVGPALTDHAPHFDTQPPTSFTPGTSNNPPSQFTVNAIIRDFHPHLPSDFQLHDSELTGVITGLVKGQLGSDGTPQPTDNTAHLADGWIESSQSFAQWFHPFDGVNLRTVYPMTFTRGTDGMYKFDASSTAGGFYPINGRLFGNENNNGTVNGNFTAEIHSTFTYHRGQTFTFKGDDDVWVFVNGYLAIDLGGVHGEEEREFTLDQTTESQFGLATREGTTVQFDMFYAEREIGASDFKATTNLPLGLDHTYSYHSHATDADGPTDTLTYSIVSGPGGATINPSSGELKWQPPQSGVYPFKIKVTDSTGLYDTQQWNLTVTGVNANTPPKVVTNYPLPRSQASVGRHYESTIDRNFFDPDGDSLTFAPVSTLPPWLTLDAGGILRGTPSAANIGGPTMVTVKAVDDRGGSVSLSFPIQVDYYPPDPPYISSVVPNHTVQFVTVKWGNSPENDVVGYNLYRGNSASGSFTKVNEDLITRSDHGLLATFVDESPRIGFPTYYQVEAIAQMDTQEMQARSPIQSVVVRDSTIPQTPYATISKDGTDAVLTWDSSDHEEDVYKYEVYAGASPTGMSLITAFDVAAPPTYTDHDPEGQHHDYFAIQAVDYSENRSDPASLIFKQTLGQILISPPAVMVQFNGTQQFSVSCFDQFGNAMPTPEDLTWSRSGDGTLSPDGLYSAPNMGTGATVTATSGPMSGNAFVGLGADTAVSAETPFTTDAALTWPALSSAQSYQIFRGTAPGFAVDDNSFVGYTIDKRSWFDHSLSPDTAYYYDLFAVTDLTTQVLIGTATVHTPATNAYHSPGAPTITGAVGINAHEILVTWTPPPSGIKYDGYLVWVSKDNGLWYPADLRPFNATSCLVRGSGPGAQDVLVADHTYRIRIQGTDDLGAEVGPSSELVSAEVHRASLTVDAGYDMVVVCGQGQWTQEDLLSGITINASDPAHPLTGQTSALGMGKIWADLVNKGYNAYLVPVPDYGGSYGGGGFGSYLQLHDVNDSKLYSVINYDGSGRIYDEILHGAWYDNSWDIGLIGYSFGGGVSEKISRRLLTSSIIPFAGVWFAATIDGVKFPASAWFGGTAMHHSPAWTSAGGYNWWTDNKGPGLIRGVHGQSLAGAFYNAGPYSNLTHTGIGFDPGIQLLVEFNCDTFYGSRNH
jgi:fibro-slime domain-containing protein